MPEPRSAVGPEPGVEAVGPVSAESVSAPRSAVAESAAPLIERDPAAELAAADLAQKIREQKAAARAVVASEGAVTLEQLTAWLVGATREEVRELVKSHPGAIGGIAGYATAEGADWKPADPFVPEDARRAIGGDHGFAEKVLRGPLAKSWHLAKKTLTGRGAAAQELMEALIRFRTLHWKSVLHLTKARITAGGLTDGFAAGSKTLTSDVDVNLKGNKTEKAVELFNHIFAKEAGWGYESGVVYDVNVYAMDFMFGALDKAPAKAAVTTPMTTPEASTGPAPGQAAAAPVGGPKVPKQEGKRAGREQGGFKETKFDRTDSLEQDAWALVKVRMHLSTSDWDAFVRDGRGIDDPAATKAKKYFLEHIRNLGGELLAAYCRGVSAPVAAAAKAKYELQASGVLLGATGVEQIEELSKAFALDDTDRPVERVAATEAQVENTKMKASNRLYESKLAQIADLRASHAALISHHDEVSRASSGTCAEPRRSVASIDIANGAVELYLMQLRRAVSASALLSNEAYITDGAVNHTVVGLQGGKELILPKRALRAAVTENYGDAMKEIAHADGDIGKALWKAAKYIWRLCDAALNLEIRNEELRPLYDLAHYLAVDLKRLTEATPEMALTAPATATARGRVLGLVSVDDLKNRLLRLARAARNSPDMRGEGLATPNGAGIASAHQAPPRGP